MSEVNRYVLVDRWDIEQDYEYEYYDDALDTAKERGCAIVKRTYVYDDSSLVWTPNGKNWWPPMDGE